VIVKIIALKGANSQDTIFSYWHCQPALPLSGTADVAFYQLETASMASPRASPA